MSPADRDLRLVEPLPGGEHAAIRGVIADLEGRVSRSTENSRRSATIVGGYYYRDDYSLARHEGYRIGLREAINALRPLLGGGEEVCDE